MTKQLVTFTTTTRPYSLLFKSAMPTLMVEPREHSVGPEGRSLQMYIHGKAQDIAGFDIPYLVEGQLDIQEGELYCILELCLNDQQKESWRMPCIAVIWDTGVKSVNLMNGKESQQFRGLLVYSQDKEALQYAREKAASKAQFC